MPASISRPRWPSRSQRGTLVEVGVVEDAARRRPGRRGRSCRLPPELRGPLDQAERGRRGPAGDVGVAQRRLVLARRRQRDHGVGEAQTAAGQAAARADADEPRRAELDQLLEHDPGRRAAHPSRLDADRPAVERPREAEHAALLVDLSPARVEERRRDVGGPPRIARAEDGGGVVTGLGPQVDRHRRRLGGRDPRPSPNRRFTSALALPTWESSQPTSATTEKRNRLTCAFRMILAIPHVIVVVLLGDRRRDRGHPAVVHHRVHRQAQPRPCGTCSGAGWPTPDGSRPTSTSCSTSTRRSAPIRRKVPMVQDLGVRRAGEPPHQRPAVHLDHPGADPAASSSASPCRSSLLIAWFAILFTGQVPARDVRLHHEGRALHAAGDRLRRC